MITVLSGLAAGAAHVVTGPDHLAALAPLAVDQPSRAWRIGLGWGLGHGAGVLVSAVLAQLLRGALSLDELGAWSERMVGVVLVVIGLWALRRASRVVVHGHDHTHAHPHPHAHEHGPRRDPRLGALGAHAHRHLHVHVRLSGRGDHDRPRAHARHSHASFWVGALHGSAGAGHALGVLPSLALPPAEAALYLAAYIVAAVASMAGVGLLLGRLAGAASQRDLRLVLRLASLVAIGVGVWWLVDSFGGGPAA